MIMPAKARPLLVVASSSVLQRLNIAQFEQVTRNLSTKSQVQDPENPNLWITKVSDIEVWGVLDEQAGHEGEDVLTIMLPEDY